ncbi:Melibiose/raffinose/stachyose import permease protein MelD [Paenibacillus auburnensis]|uniref:Melibiose/raffinose/stachyose import permease protein MelD n=1 Tax=Paenibacillus auburnensis TaxID=2905649 RepID=A0ABN8GGF3_9BACL|nr:sugar ABC transporter permease [Paenibacillus auburnensis]CAH1208269.1 Melibiose/raffinose/stachyose import permease protein MelD [Paenibacillus auburnensis]
MSKVVSRRISRQTWSEWSWGWFLIAPTMIGLIVLNIIPIIQTAYLSFFKSGDFGRGNIFVGLDNYRKMFDDVQVWHAVGNTLLYAVLVVPISIALSLIVAVLLNGEIRGKSLYRTIYFIPMVAAPAAVTMVWRWLYNEHFGLINYVLSRIGINAVDWVGNPKVSLISIAIIGIWSVIGYNMVLLLAGLQEIPKDFYEASEIDGASKLRQFFVITLPLLSPTLFFVVVTSVIQAMQVFDVIYMMIDVTSPAYEHTVSLVYLFYNNSFKYSNKGYGSAIVILLLAIIMVITFLQVRGQKKWVNYM